MKIDVKKVAKLANLTLTPKEETEFDTQLSNIVGYIEKLNAINTDNIVPTAQVTGLTNCTRPDEDPHVELSQVEAVSSARKSHNGMFVVEKLVDTTS